MKLILPLYSLIHCHISHDSLFVYETSSGTSLTCSGRYTTKQAARDSPVVGNSIFPYVYFYLFMLLMNDEAYWLEKSAGARGHVIVVIFDILEYFVSRFASLLFCRGRNTLTHLMVGRWCYILNFMLDLQVVSPPYYRRVIRSIIDSDIEIV
jgi:hypothetical protein